ncbi:DNA cytosine methyltransferase [Pseudomonas aeruginosa]|uniref:DNA cytosine methyltransferase n=1 Tax=Pseudomonas aeruginosa TaxID=287 RepID=UPI000717A578|nr:DNA methyltransferase [Pseudomonas aeruginosa]VEE77307.1 C-5 cytosine-specific DNA methylase [Pseudomonas aeruginosa]
MMINKEYTHFGFCCGSGSGSAGFNDSKQVLGNIRGSWRCIGGVDVDPDGLEDFHMMTGVKGTLLDLFTRDQYMRFHGKEPPRDWREATPEDIRRAAGNEFPYAVFISSPCKGATGLVAESMSMTPRYQALNELTLRCVWLMLEAWKDDPVSMIVFENVPRLASRGRHLLDQIVKLLNHFGYAVAETVHNCGEIGNLAQSRPRFLLVARHVDKVPAFLYQPQTYRLRPVGDVLGRMPLAGDIDLAGPMHRVPNCQWKTWLRLALVKAGSDWRSLNDYVIEDGYLRDYIVVPEYHSGFLGVHGWEDTVGTVAGRSGPTNGAFSVADPRYEQSARWNHGQQFGVLEWSDTAGTVTGQKSPGQGPYSIADPRPNWARHSNNFKVVRWDRHAGTITGGGKGVQGGWPSIADPRPGNAKQKGDAYFTNGHYGVVDWNGSTGAVSASACHDNGRWSVADARMPAPNDRMSCVIRSLDGTWHRPFTTLELAALQSFFDPEDIWQKDPDTGLLQRHGEIFQMYGNNDSAWRERIGNAVPRKAGKAIADVMLTTLMLADAGETFTLNALPVWVRPLATAISLSRQEVQP